MSAEPASGCSVIKKAGKKMIKNALIWFFIKLKLYCLSLNSLATAKAVQALTNSEGCKLITPKLNQDFAPLISFPKGNKRIKENIEIIYKRLEKRS